MTLNCQLILREERAMRKKQSPEEKALLDLFNAWNELCPTVDKGKAIDLVKDMIDDGTHDKRAHCRAVVGRLYDGLAYGNWPSA
jgi:hypothetical protein